METNRIIDSHPLCQVVLRQFKAIVEDTDVTDGSGEFYEWLKVKKENVNWVKTFNILKTELSKDLEEEWCDMWKKENFEEKLDALEKLKDLYKNKNERAWRPETGDIGPQTVNLDIKFLTEVKNNYSKLVAIEEDQLKKLKTDVSTERSLLREYQKKVRDAKDYNYSLCKDISKNIDENLDCISDGYAED